MRQYILFGVLMLELIVSGQSLPQKISPTIMNRSCLVDMKPTGSEKELESVISLANSYLTSRYGPPCQCGGKWKNIVDLDMSDSSQSCPSNWQLVDNNFVRGCIRQSGTCTSAVFSTNAPYSKVCGQVRAVQFGTPDAFHQGVFHNEGIEGPYIDGVSITHGAPGSRKHVWSFVAANSDQSPHTLQKCPCSDTTSSWPYSVPSFIGNDYFCDSGQETFSYSFIYFSDDPLWDGQGCSPTSSCCRLNNPPWFCTDIGNAVSDDIEVRICASHGAADEEIVVTKLEFFVQ